MNSVRVTFLQFGHTLHEIRPSCKCANHAVELNSNSPAQDGTCPFHKPLCLHQTCFFPNHNHPKSNKCTNRTHATHTQVQHTLQQHPPATHSRNTITQHTHTTHSRNSLTQHTHATHSMQVQQTLQKQETPWPSMAPNPIRGKLVPHNPQPYNQMTERAQHAVLDAPTGWATPGAGVAGRHGGGGGEWF